MGNRIPCLHRRLLLRQYIALFFVVSRQRTGLDFAKIDNPYRAVMLSFLSVCRSIRTCMQVSVRRKDFGSSQEPAEDPAHALSGSSAHRTTAINGIYLETTSELCAACLQGARREHSRPLVAQSKWSGVCKIAGRSNRLVSLIFTAAQRFPLKPERATNVSAFTLLSVPLAATNLAKSPLSLGWMGAGKSLLPLHVHSVHISPMYPGRLICTFVALKVLAACSWR